MSIEFLSRVANSIITFSIGPENNGFRELAIQYDREWAQSQWLRSHQELFEEHGINAVFWKLQVQNELTAMFPSVKLEDFLEALMVLDDFVVETEINKIRFNSDDTEIYNIISATFDRRNVPFITFDDLESANKDCSRHWLHVVEKLKPQKVHIGGIVFMKGSIEFLLKLAKFVPIVYIMDVSIDPDSHNMRLGGPKRAEYRLGIVRMLAREMLNRQCRTLFIGVPFRKSDAEKLIESLHHIDKPVSFGTWAGPATNEHVDTQIGKYIVKDFRANDERILSIVHTDLDNPFS